MRVNVAIDSMLAMRLNAYMINCLKCLWVKVGLFELEKLIEIRILAYLRVANPETFSKQTDMQRLFPN